MSKHEATVIIAQPSSKVFDFMLDFQQWGHWHQGHIEMQQMSAGALDVGATLRQVFWLIPPFKGKAIYQITTFEPGKRLAYKSLESAVQVKIWYTLEPIEGGTRVTLANETQPSAGLRIFERLFPKMGQQFIEREAQQLKNMLEASHS